MVDTPIESVEASVYTVPTDAPEADGTLSWDSTTMVLVQARAGSQCGTGWTYGSPACAGVVAGKLAAVVRGRDPMDTGDAFEAMVRAVRNDGRPGAVRAEVPVYGSGGFTTYSEQQLHDQLSGWALEQRIPRVKIKVGESWGTAAGRDLKRMAQARKVIGEQTELFVDANGGYSRKQAIRVMAAAADLDVRWLEEPVSSDDLDGLREVRDAVQADVTAGEYGYDLAYFRRMCAARAVDCLQADVSRCGGITEWLRAAAVAASYRLQVSGHCAPHLHAAAATAVTNLRHLEWFHDHVRIEKMFFDGALDPAGGTIRPDPGAPGLGLTLRTSDAERYQAQ
jgi:L-alanine-DL-glutamate epimerase-like enolase superfamily enzyme